MSSDIAWAVTRNNSAFLLKKRGCPKPFSTDPLNLTNKNSQRYNGYLHKKAVGIAAMDKGFAVSVKKPSRASRPGRSIQGRYSVLSRVSRHLCHRKLHISRPCCRMLQFVEILLHRCEIGC